MWPSRVLTRREAVGAASYLRRRRVRVFCRVPPQPDAALPAGTAGAPFKAPVAGVGAKAGSLGIAAGAAGATGTGATGAGATGSTATGAGATGSTATGAGATGSTATGA